MEDVKTELHPLKPFLPINARILMLGSFPPARSRWSMDFYYPNFQNDMWRIFGLIFKKDKDYFVNPQQKSFDKEKIISFLNETGIALSDTALKIIRQKENASDKFLEIVETMDIESLLFQLPQCKAIVTTGQKATEILIQTVNAKEPKVGENCQFSFANREITLFRMPSSSRAYPKSIEKKSEIYFQMFQNIGLISREKL